jgi:hypothetical protein
MLWDGSYKESKFGSAESCKVGPQKRGGGVAADCGPSGVGVGCIWLLHHLLR